MSASTCATLALIEPISANVRVLMIEAQTRKLKYVPLDTLKPDPRNPRKHTRAQIQAIAKSVEAFGFNAPILVDREHHVLAGHGRLEAAKLLRLEQVPMIS